MKYKYIDYNVYGDSPFIGALIVANNCHNNCINCQNQELKKMIPKEESADKIIEQVLSNGVIEGIILGGLEWTEQPNDMIELSLAAIKNKLKIIIYTGLTEYKFKKIKDIDILFNKDIYVKFGKYDENLLCDDNIQYGIKLATSNQYIKKLGDK